MQQLYPDPASRSGPVAPHKELADWVPSWPRPPPHPAYHLLWPGRPLPHLPGKEGPASPPDFSEMFARTSQEPLFGLFFSNNNFNNQSKESKSKRADAISQFMDGPFFRYLEFWW